MNLLPLQYPHNVSHSGIFEYSIIYPSPCLTASFYHYFLSHTHCSYFTTTVWPVPHMPGYIHLSCVTLQLTLYSCTGHRWRQNMFNSSQPVERAHPHISLTLYKLFFSFSFILSTHTLKTMLMLPKLTHPLYIIYNI